MKVAKYITSLLDYPDHVSTVLFTLGCNFRCGYCSNYELFDETQHFIPVTNLLSILQLRVKICDHIVITGGEPTIHSELVEFLRDIKTIGYKVKLDTNGSNPDVLQKCMPYLDYIALDIKTDLSRYPFLFFNFNSQNLIDTISLIKKGGIPYEFRTVLCPLLVDVGNFDEILDLMGKFDTYRLLQFYPDKCFDKKYMNIKPYSTEALVEFKRKAEYSNNISKVLL
jgi:pyruvate formate lyase activating enzyme